MLTFTNNENAIQEKLESITVAEFKPVKVVFEPKFNQEHLGRGEYIRFWLNDDRQMSRHSDGETREYEFTVSYYINERSILNIETIKKIYTDRKERLKQLFNNNYEIQSPSYVWHSLNAQSISYETAVEELEEEPLKGVKVINFIIVIIRSNFY